MASSLSGSKLEVASATRPSSLWVSTETQKSAGSALIRAGANWCHQGVPARRQLPGDGPMRERGLMAAYRRAHKIWEPSLS